MCLYGVPVSIMHMHAMCAILSPYLSFVPSDIFQCLFISLSVVRPIPGSITGSMFSASSTDLSTFSHGWALSLMTFLPCPIQRNNTSGNFPYTSEYIPHNLMVYRAVLELRDCTNLLITLNLISGILLLGVSFVYLFIIYLFIYLFIYFHFCS